MKIERGCTPLSAAIDNGVEAIAIVKLLLANGAKVHQLCPDSVCETDRSLLNGWLASTSLTVAGGK